MCAKQTSSAANIFYSNGGVGNTGDALCRYLRNNPPAKAKMVPSGEEGVFTCEC